MFSLLKSLIRIKVSVLISVAVALLVTGWLRLRDLHRSWGIDATDAARALPGDDLVRDPGITDTRTLTVEAPPSAVWPWLVQMGFGRGGWYSYDRMDMKGSSANRILPEYQHLAVGDTVPTYPGGGFEARIVDREKALVLYLDTDLVKAQVADLSPTSADQASAAAEGLPAGLKAAGAMGEMTMPEFRASWAFVLEPEDGGRTRLIERFRVWTGEAGLPQKLGLPFMGYGVFAMTRKQMLGIKERAERLARSGWAAPAPGSNGSAHTNGAAPHESETTTVGAPGSPAEEPSTSD
ncbi:hypothetical protein BH23CHL8_BH23CHL8_26790 [soil metagenome]